MKNLNLFFKEVEYAFNNVPFYHDLFNQEHIDLIKGAGEDVLAKLPFTSKVDYRKNFPRGTLAEGFTLNHPMLTNSRSSGSTGERLITLEIGMYLLNRAMSCAEVNPYILKAFSKMNRKIARYAAPNCSDVECANPNSSIEDRVLSDKTLVLPVYHDVLTTSEAMIDRTIKEIEIYEPDLFYVDPTHFSFLLREYKKRGLTPPPIPVMAAYTGATRCSKRQISEFYSMDTMYGELLSSTEFGWVAMECPYGHLHANDDSFFIEYIDTDIKSVLPVQYKEMCISSIDQGASPHVRYRTGDIVTLVNGPCECGSDRQRIVMEGKISHFIVKDDRPVLSPQQVDSLMGAPEWLDLYQLEQIKEKEFSLKIIVNDSYQANSENYFITAFQEVLGSDVVVRTSVVDYIAAERSGKFQYVRGLHTNV